ncbi:hypothetical protein AQ616_18470 [Oceanobacillus sp. E9]|nr:hypothetical protein AQ616_18470 [Oceanobacillus sp. E9]
MSILENIQSLCREHGISIPSLEKGLGLGKGSMYRWNTNSPSIDKLQKVANYFKVTLDEIIGWGSIYDIGWTIKDEREEQSLSIETLAIESDIPVSTLQEIEEDLIPLNSEQLKAITDVFGMTVQEHLVKYDMYDETIHEYFRGDVNAFVEFEKAKFKDAMKENNQQVETIAAHHDGEEWTEEEREEIERFKEFVRSKRQQQGD